MSFDCGLCVPVFIISAKITWFSRTSSLELCQLKGKISKFIEISRSQLDQLSDVAVCFGEEDLLQFMDFFTKCSFCFSQKMLSWRFYLYILSSYLPNTVNCVCIIFLS